ncbi:aminotransferase class III-fold pyridoxal phosphate-dependent enzyme [Pseudoroseomonas wenyumeiae]|uniref:Aminotransferase class III-fold pyridoxal phosphate-dependent enzyme n=2 Tax=Teichococcus wenyumeiae TaxID=2478470 RepID=A0A3A9JQL8_9PROT|nr:aminotransferase class III-fold pyridoxal phosphate-dependent enzyme [Pseudoroseomonas wenyumeiae]RMI19746.1 aminotransferase class III-fold pyridoxal phosphate-dependent enzyme [Pseudoroseomonas wenyumeiae]
MVRSLSQGTALMERARAVIPNGMYGHESVGLLPEGYPQFFAKARGARLWDADGNEYIDYMCAFGPNLFGYGQPEIEAAADAQRALGDTMTGPAEAMIAFAEAMVAQVSHADWAMFCKNGTDATSMAIATARAHTGRGKILVGRGAYHGASGWATQRSSRGLMPEDKAHVIHFRYNDAESLADAARQAGDDLAGILVTPFRHEIFQDQFLPDPEFLQLARQICDRTEALLIVDDVRAGFRLDRDCSIEQFGVSPDLSCWGKAIANGQPISALLGVEKARQAAGSIVATGSFWFSAVPMAAGVATMRKIRETDYLEHTIAMGQALRDGLQQQAAAHGFTLRQTGPAQMPQILFEEDPDFRLGYAWVVEALDRGVYLSPYHNMFLCAALTEADIRLTLDRTDDAFAALKAKRDTVRPLEKIQPLVAAIRAANR